MIQSNELRIGNVIWDDACYELHGNGLVKIKSLSETIAHYTSLIKSDFGKFNSGVSYINAKGVLITPEILKNFGFEEYGWYNINEYEDELIFSIRCQETDYKVCFVKTTGEDIEQSIRFKQDHDIIYLKKPLQFVHQLQNLYLDFTGEELVFNPYL